MVKPCEIDISEFNYDAGRSTETLKIVDLGYQEFAPVGRISFSLVSRFRNVHETFFFLSSTWRDLTTSNSQPFFLPQTRILEITDQVETAYLQSHSVQRYHFLNEQFVFQMRRFFETYLHHLQIQLFRQSTGALEEIPDSIQIDSLGELLKRNSSNDNEAILRVFFGANISESTDLHFIQLLNKLGNAMRHHPYFDEAYTLLGRDRPTLVGIEMRSKDTSHGIFHNHNCKHILMGFQDTTMRILERAKQEFRNN